MIITNSGQEYYKKQVEVARICKVSQGTITNWINKAKDNKNLLQLIDIDGRFYIVRSEHNSAELAKLAAEAEGYQNVEYTDIYPKDELYETLNEDQLLALINTIKINKSIPLKYSYLGSGADNWDKFYNTLNKTGDVEIKKYGLESHKFLLEKALSFLDTYLDNFNLVNIIEIGPGNSRPSQFSIQNYINSKKLNEYIAIDISDRMLEIAKTNFIKNFPEKYFNSHVLDLEINSLQNILFKHKENLNGDKIVNIIICLGGTFGNFESQDKVLQNIKEGMFPEDILIIDNLFDVPSERSHFVTIGKELGDIYSLSTTRLLNLDGNYFDKNLGYNPESKYREYDLVIKTPLRINFRNQKAIIFEKYDKINVWKHCQESFESISEKMKRNGFKLQYIAKNHTESLSKIISISKVI